MKYIFSKAYAKINLALDIKGTDSRGYHIIESVMKRIDIFDSVFVCTQDGFENFIQYAAGELYEECREKFFSSVENGDKICLESNCRNILPMNEGNIAWKAARLFIDSANIEEPVFIYIKKVIPIGGGLAGGSTDGACILRMLNNLFGMPLTSSEIYELASRLGSDVPFFLSPRPALVTGTGTEIERLNNFTKMHIVLVNPGFSSSTEKAYKAFDQCTVPDCYRPDIGKLIEDLYKGDIVSACNNMKNVLEVPVLTYFGKIESLKNEMTMQPGALCSFMSGSGSTVVGIFDCFENAFSAKNYFRKNKLRAWYSN